MKSKKTIAAILLILLGILPLANLLTPGLPVTHDGQDHVARIANFYASLAEGNPVPRWAANLNWGYGHPIFMFLYPLPSYAAAAVHFLGFSFVDSVKIVFAVSYIGSIVAMYLWLVSQWGVLPGMVGAVLYGFAPYRFVDLYVRGALGEHMAFLFPPLILLGLYLFARQRSKGSGMLIALSTAGLILSHNAISLMFLPVILAYVFYLFFYEPSRHRHFFLSAWYFIFLGFALAAFFWIPAFFEGKYTLRDIVTSSEFADRFVPWKWFFRSPWTYGGGNEITKEVGLVHWLAILGSVIFLLKNTVRRLRMFVGGGLVVFVFSLFIMTSWSYAVWQRVTILQKFQFPWRFMSLAVFVSATLGGVALAQVPKKTVRVVSIVMIAASIILSVHMWRAKAYVEQPDTYYAGIYAGTTDTGESSPIWSVRFMESKPPAQVAVIEGSAEVLVDLRTTTKRRYVVRADTRSRLVEYTLYFPGWRVTIDGGEQLIEFQDPNYRGIMTFWVDPGEHLVDIAFRETKLRKFANIVSVAGFVVLLVTWYAKILYRT